MFLHLARDNFGPDRRMRGDDAARDAAAVAADRAANPDRDRVNECDASLLREREEDHRVPKIAEPIRTWVAPSSIAMAKSALMPIDSCFKPVAFRDLRGEREMRRGRIVDRRDAHQPGNRQTIGVAARSDKIIGVRRRDAGLLRLLAGVELHEQIRPAILLRDFLGQRFANARAVHRMDGIEQRDRFLGLVGLQRADQMQRKAGMRRDQRRAILPWPPARDFRRTPVAPRRSPARSHPHRRFSTPPPASPTIVRAAHPGRRARSPPQPRQVRVGKGSSYRLVKDYSHGSGGHLIHQT